MYILNVVKRKYIHKMLEMLGKHNMLQNDDMIYIKCSSPFLFCL